MTTRTMDRAMAFCKTFGMRCPIVLSPMAGACPSSLSIAVGNAGGMGGMGALLTPPAGIRTWAGEVRAQTSGPFQINVWIPDSPAQRNPDAEAKLRDFLAEWGPR